MKSIIYTLYIPMSIGLSIFCNVEIQSQTYDANTEQLSKTVLSRNMYFENTSKKEVRGSPYVLEEFASGKVALIDGSVLRHDQINYSLYEDEVHFNMKSMDTLFFYPKDYIEHIVLDGDKYYFDRRKNDKEGIMRLMYEGENFSLGINYSLSYRKSNYVEGLDMGRRYDEFIRDEELLVLHGTKMYKIKKRSDLKAFGKYRKDADEFVKKNKLKASNQKDLLRLVRYIDGLAD